MIKVLRTRSRTGSSIVRSGDLAEHVVEIAALDEELVYLDRLLANEGGKIGSDGGAVLGQRAQLHAAVGAADGLNRAHAGEARQRAGDGLGPIGGDADGDGAMMREPPHEVLRGAVGDDPAAV